MRLQVGVGSCKMGEHFYRMGDCISGLGERSLNVYQVHKVIKLMAECIGGMEILFENRIQPVGQCRYIKEMSDYYE